MRLEPSPSIEEARVQRVLAANRLRAARKAWARCHIGEGNQRRYSSINEMQRAAMELDLARKESLMAETQWEIVERRALWEGS